MRLIFHGELRKRFGHDVVMDVDSIAEAIEGYSRQVDWPKDMLVEVAGYLEPERWLEKPDEIHILPAMIGGGGKFGSIILGTALVVAGILLIGTPVGWSLIISGGLMIAQGVFALFLKTPKMGKNSDPEASNYLGVNKNTTAVGTRMTMAWGRIDLAGHWLSLQSDSSNLSFGMFPSNPT